MDQRWRKALIRHVELAKPTVLLDLATGTGDLSTALAQHMPSTQIMGTDIYQRNDGAGKGESP